MTNDLLTFQRQHAEGQCQNRGNQHQHIVEVEPVVWQHFPDHEPYSNCDGNEDKASEDNTNDHARVVRGHHRALLTPLKMCICAARRGRLKPGSNSLVHRRWLLVYYRSETTRSRKIGFHIRILHLTL